MITEVGHYLSPHGKGIWYNSDANMTDDNRDKLAMQCKDNDRASTDTLQGVT